MYKGLWPKLKWLCLFEELIDFQNSQNPGFKLKFQQVPTFTNSSPNTKSLLQKIRKKPTKFWQETTFKLKKFPKSQIPNRANHSWKKSSVGGKYYKDCFITNTNAKLSLTSKNGSTLLTWLNSWSTNSFTFNEWLIINVQ